MMGRKTGKGQGERGAAGALGVGAALVLALILGPAGTARADDGSVLYKNNCSACHGNRGDGRGPAATGLSPPPPDFADPAFWKGVTDSYLLHVITNGLGPMPGWGQTLSPLDVENLLDYIKTFRKG